MGKERCYTYRSLDTSNWNGKECSGSKKDMCAVRRKCRSIGTDTGTETNPGGGIVGTFTCALGQGEKGKFTVATAENTEAGCRSLCVNVHKGCLGFDFTTKKQGDSCRLYTAYGTPRLGSSGSGRDRRSFCSLPQPDPNPNGCKTYREHKVCVAPAVPLAVALAGVTACAHPLVKIDFHTSVVGFTAICCVVAAGLWVRPCADRVLTPC